MISGLPTALLNTPAQRISIMNKIKGFIDELINGLLPTFKNEEITIENIGEKFSKIDFNKLNLNEEEVTHKLLNSIGFRIEKFKINEIIKPKKCNSTATAQRDISYTSNAIEQNEEQINTLAKAFNESRENIISGLSNGTHFAIKHEGKTIGYYSFLINNGELNIGNFTILPEYRNSKAAMNALLTLRDNALAIAKEKGIKKVTADVNANNPKLLGLYQRFGFEPNDKISFEYVNDSGEDIKEGYYQLQILLT